MSTSILFVHGAGDGAYEEDALLVASLRDALGPSYEVRYPRMPLEDSATYSDWTARIDSALPPGGSEVVLVGHSVGGSVLLRHLCEKPIEATVTGLFVIAAPFWGADDFWEWDEARLPEDAAEKLAGVPRIFLYHSGDDEVVPFSHLALYSARLARATIRSVDGGHQLGNDLAEVAHDIARVRRGHGSFTPRHMTIQRMEHVGIVVDDLASATAFFVELGLEMQGEGSVEGSWVDRIVGLDGVHTEFAMLQTPDGHGRLELVRFLEPPAHGGDRHAPANTPGIRHIAFSVDDIDAVVARLQALGAELVGEIEDYEGIYRLCYVRGPEGIIVELAERIG